ncbi:MAG: zf-HC2 domain-containing protein [Candidatus Aminicenantes bacterium]|nr:zf-HC2 domain-containing protein [Candidatus Aminicenantes bacterium]
MRCKDIERLMIDASERPLSLDEAGMLDRHVLRCVSCSQFKKDLARIREELKTVSVPVLSEDLEERTLAGCRYLADRSTLPDSGVLSRIRSASIPGLVWTALILLVILTGILVISFLPGFESGNTVPFQAILALTLLAQNVVMLFFAPVLVTKLRECRGGNTLGGNKKLVL